MLPSIIGELIPFIRVLNASASHFANYGKIVLKYLPKFMKVIFCLSFSSNRIKGNRERKDLFNKAYFDPKYFYNLGTHRGKRLYLCVF